MGKAWGPAGVAYHVARRPLLQGEDRPRLDEWRRRLEDVELRGLECFAKARLGLGGPTLPQAEDCARQLIEVAPYDRLRVLLRDELGVAPSPSVQGVHKRLLGERTTTAA